ncbi:hypothetical protein DMC01_03660 [Campylobacter troglodytis]|nr:hypothetical protein DMC01_03660 [Campylobacter troglodytis]
MSLQEGAKAQGRVKHSKNEFANNHINATVNFLCFLFLQLRSRRAFTKHSLAKLIRNQKRKFLASSKRNKI